MFYPDKSRPPTNQNGKSFVETVGAASGKLQLSEIVNEATDVGFNIGIKVGGKEIPSDVPGYCKNQRVLLSLLVFALDVQKKIKK